MGVRSEIGLVGEEAKWDKKGSQGSVPPRPPVEEQLEVAPPLREQEGVTPSSGASVLP